MAQPASSVDVLWGTLRALPRESRERFMDRLVADAALREELEDALDLAVARERANEPVRPLGDVLREHDEL